jgi:hypothetical protein
VEDTGDNQMNELVDLFVNPTADKIDQYEAIVGQMPQVDLKTTHAVSGGVYSRTIFIPAGVSLVGATHSKDHINIMFGDITVTTDTGMKRLTGYNVFATKAGMRRVGYAHADTYWTSVIHTTETEISKIEEDITPDSHKLQTRNLRVTSEPVNVLEEV